MAIAFRCQFYFTAEGHSYFAREGQRRLPSGANALGFSNQFWYKNKLNFCNFQTICEKVTKTLVFGHGKILLNAPKGSEQISSEPFGAIKYNVSKPS